MESDQDKEIEHGSDLASIEQEMTKALSERLDQQGQEAERVSEPHPETEGGKERASRKKKAKPPADDKAPAEPSRPRATGPDADLPSELLKELGFESPDELKTAAKEGRRAQTERQQLDARWQEIVEREKAIEQRQKDLESQFLDDPWEAARRLNDARVRAGMDPIRPPWMDREPSRPKRQPQNPQGDEEDEMGEFRRYLHGDDGEAEERGSRGDDFMSEDELYSAIDQRVERLVEKRLAAERERQTEQATESAKDQIIQREVAGLLQGKDHLKPLQGDILRAIYEDVYHARQRRTEPSGSGLTPEGYASWARDLADRHVGRFSQAVGHQTQRRLEAHERALKDLPAAAPMGGMTPTPTRGAEHISEGDKPANQFISECEDLISRHEAAMRGGLPSR